MSEKMANQAASQSMELPADDGFGPVAEDALNAIRGAVFGAPGALLNSSDASELAARTGNAFLKGCRSLYESVRDAAQSVRKQAADDAWEELEDPPNESNNGNGGGGGGEGWHRGTIEGPKDRESHHLKPKGAAESAPPTNQYKLPKVELNDNKKK
jgi:hypothetical protein